MRYQRLETRAPLRNLSAGSEIVRTGRPSFPGACLVRPRVHGHCICSEWP